MEQFEELIGQILTDFRERKTNYPQAIVAIENLILNRLGFTLAEVERSLKIELNVKRIINEQIRETKQESDDGN